MRGSGVKINSFFNHSYLKTYSSSKILQKNELFKKIFERECLNKLLNNIIIYRSLLISTENHSYHCKEQCFFCKLFPFKHSFHSLARDSAAVRQKNMIYHFKEFFLFILSTHMRNQFTISSRYP